MSSPVENPTHDDLQDPLKKVVEGKDAAKDWKEANAVDVITDTAEDYSKELRRVIDKHDRISQLAQEEKEKIQKFEDSISSRMEELKIKFNGEIEEMKIEFCEEIEKLKKDTEARENALLASRHALTLKAELWVKAAAVVEQITEELMTSRRAIVADTRVMGLIPRAPFANFKVAIDKNSFESLPEREKNLINFFAVTKQYQLILEDLDGARTDASSKDKVSASEARKSEASISKGSSSKEAAAKASSSSGGYKKKGEMKGSGS